MQGDSRIRKYEKTNKKGLENMKKTNKKNNKRPIVEPMVLRRFRCQSERDHNMKACILRQFTGETTSMRTIH